MTVVFPPTTWEKDYGAALFPFQLKSLYETPLFKEVLMPKGSTLGERCNFDQKAMAWGKLMKAYMRIAKEFYGLEVDFEYPVVVVTKDPDTGLECHFKINIDTQFIRVVKRGKLKPLSKSVKKQLLANTDKPELWLEAIPPENFEFHGFTVMRAVDVTDQEVLSSLKRDLIEKESIFSKDGFMGLEQKIRTFLRKPDLVLGLAALQGDQVLILSPHYKIEHGCIFADSHHLRKCDFEGTVFAQAVDEGKPLVIEDMEAFKSRSPLEKEIMEKKGVKSLFVAPLHYQDQLLGTLDLKSPHVGDLNHMGLMKMWEILPLFSMALKRGMEELDNRVQAVIKEKCTAIHPSVEWRFRQAALNFMSKQDDGPSGLEPIVFRDVHPLYGVSDIRGSSEHRNASIQSDLMDHLNLTREIVLLANKKRSLPILNALAYWIEKNRSEIEGGLTSGDEVAKLDFIRHVVEPVLGHIEGFSPEVKKKIEAYRKALDPNLGTLYRKRKDFEETVTLINDTLAAYLDREEERAQNYFPHYYEKLKTDGVDHTIYVGASMVEDGGYDPLYLRNLRLWELMVMCGAVWQVERIKPQLKLPLDCCHLILVHDTPLSIRFRGEERRFDVDGAYDIRHEIIKKRIDKATIKGTSERLTQPGKIAIVYSHRREALEYGEYIDYLRASGYLDDEVESLDLEDLQGVHGLKALRVPVKTQAPEVQEGVVPEEIDRAVRSMAPAESA
jgi:GAF domain-containing protein